MAELTKRYIVMTMATEAPFDLTDADGVFVLKPWKDPAALCALEAYRDHCYPELARELDAWIRTIKAGPAVRGGVGKRNEPYLKAAGPPAAARPTAKAKAKKKPASKKKTVKKRKR
ncbi:MAG: hypothetical protein HY613_10780 [Candidatus Rokubacteria bacterium]|nr:hypothetical protein [Candidatus Rokubacteria bacterium]